MSQTFIAEPNSIVTESYVLLGVFQTKEEAENCMSYVRTRFFRFLCQPTIVSPDVSKRTFIFVPRQEYTHKWNDDMLYSQYGLSAEQIDYIESLIKDFSDGGDTDAE